MNKNLRLTSSSTIREVRKRGRSWTHPLFVLTVLGAEDGETLQIGVIATKSVGGAVQRNRAKRLLREAVNAEHERIRPGNLLLLIARKPIAEAEGPEVIEALDTLLAKADLLI